MKIFISHSSKYDEVVKRMEKILQKYQIEYFADHNHIRQGVSIQNKVDGGMRDATHFFLIWCKSAQDSQYVIDELETVVSPGYGDIVIRIPFILDNTPLPTGFASKYQNKIDENNVEEITRNVIKDILEVDVNMIDEFDEYLDETYENVKIDEVYYAFSQVLRSVDKTKYNIRFHQWIESQMENREEFAKENYSEDYS